VFDHGAIAARMQLVVDTRDALKGIKVAGGRSVG
jgi:hypothetical protein